MGSINTFIKKCLVFTIPIVFVIFLWLFLFGVPIPRLSTSISFNTKIESIKRSEIDSSMTVLAIGSSMCLNNINTKCLVEKFGESYLNVSSWGQNIEEDYKLLKIFAKKYNPSILIIASNYMDFYASTKEIDFNLVDRYLSDQFLPLNFDLKYIYNSTETAITYRSETNSIHYNYLHYDKNGGINLIKNNFVINPLRWNGNSISEFEIDSNQYHYLDSIAQFCNIKDISFTFVQTPLRARYYTHLKKQEIDSIQSHIQKSAAIIENYGHTFINCTTRLWDDSLFIDYSHFSNRGSMIFTEYFINEMDLKYGQKQNKETTHG